MTLTQEQITKECLMCDHEFNLNEIFIAHTDDKGKIDCSLCMRCVDTEPDSVKNKKERNGGWLVCRNSLKGLEMASFFG